MWAFRNTLLLLLFSFSHRSSAKSIGHLANNMNRKDNHMLFESSTKVKYNLLVIRGGYVDSIASVSKSSLSQLSNKISLPVLKVILQVSLTFFNMLCWAIPLRSENFSQNKFALGVANAFSGGIFLMLSFGHMIPHSVEILESLQMDSGIAFKCALLGYLIIFSMEKVFFNSHAMLHSMTADVNNGHDHSHSHGHLTHSHATTTASHDHDHTHDSISCTLRNNELELPTKTGSLSPNSAVLLLVAMGVHSLFETMALGVASDKTSALFMAASVGLHQPAESLALLVAFLKTNLSKAAIARWLGLYSCIGTLGVSTGLLVSQLASPLLSAAIVAVTAGTFLYVAATEVINEEFEDVQGWDKWARYGGLLSGAGLIYLVTTLTERWEGHGHSHSHGHGHSHE